MKRILSIVITAILAGVFAFTGLAPASASPRTGALHITKECSEFTGAAGSFCTITSSNLTMIPTGSQVIYLEAANFVIGLLNTDIVLDTGDGNKAFGHVVLHLATGTGTVTFNGGTGKFEDFHARAAVYPLGSPNWAWEGTYHFSPDD
jgi:hypothetical protein